MAAVERARNATKYSSSRNTRRKKRLFFVYLVGLSSLFFVAGGWVRACVRPARIEPRTDASDIPERFGHQLHRIAASGWSLRFR